MTLVRTFFFKGWSARFFVLTVCLGVEFEALAFGADVVDTPAVKPSLNPPPEPLAPDAPS